MIVPSADEVRAAFQGSTGLPAWSIRRLLRGYSSIAFVCDSETSRYLLKIPHEGQARITKALRCSNAVREASVPTPRVVAHQLTKEPYGWPFWVQEWLPGEDAARLWPGLSTSEREAVASTFGEWTGRMHAAPFEDDASWRDRPREDCERAVRAAVDLGLLSEHDGKRVRDAVAALVDVWPEVEPRLCNRDLHLGNVLISNERPRHALALLDIAECYGGDPAEDFAGLVSTFERVADVRLPFRNAYLAVVRASPMFTMRAELFCLIRMVASLAYYVRMSNEPDAIRPWRHRNDAEVLAGFQDRLQEWLRGGSSCGAAGLSDFGAETSEGRASY